jgi:hypothetical protein
VSTSQPTSALWPADVIHVNEDGWVLINRGSRHGVAVGLRLLVVGTGVRDLRDLFAPDAPDSSAAAADTQPPVLRIRRTYELLEVVYTEESCAIAIATRTPEARRPTVYRGPEGELLVWVPLPEGYTWPPANNSSTDHRTASPWASADESADDTEDIEDTDEASGEPDAPPERAFQDDEPWEEALPLNSVSVGDIVLPAMPAFPAAPSASTSSFAVTSNPATDPIDPSAPSALGRTYDWMKKPGE